MDKQKRAQMITRYVKWSDLAVADLIFGCTDYKGRPIMERYGNAPRHLILMAYTLGVADGKHLERARKKRGV